MKVGVWYEASLIGNIIKIIVMRISEDVVTKSYGDLRYFTCYKIVFYGSKKEPCDIVEENWNFRELSSLEQELL